jgi:hypothetical protein
MRRLLSVAACVTLAAGLMASGPALAQRFHGGYGGGFRGGAFRPAFGGARYMRPGFGGVYRGYPGYWHGGVYAGRGYYPRYWRARPHYLGYPGWGYPGWYPGYYDWGWYNAGWAPFAVAALAAPLVIAATAQPSYAEVPLGGFCATPVRTCQLYAAAPIGTGCSCRVAGGRARGAVTP